MEWMAYDLTKDPELYKKYNDELSMNKQLAMTDEERALLIKQAFFQG